MQSAPSALRCRVTCEVISLEYRGRKQVSHLRLLEVVKQQRMEDLVFSPGPRRLGRNGVDAQGDAEGDE